MLMTRAPTSLVPSFSGTTQGDHGVITMTLRGIGNDGSGLVANQTKVLTAAPLRLLLAAVVVNLIATVLKFGDRTQLGATQSLFWTQVMPSKV